MSVRSALVLALCLAVAASAGADDVDEAQATAAASTRDLALGAADEAYVLQADKKADPFDPRRRPDLLASLRPLAECGEHGIRVLVEFLEISIPSNAEILTRAAQLLAKPDRHSAGLTALEEASRKLRIQTTRQTGRWLTSQLHCAAQDTLASMGPAGASALGKLRELHAACGPGSDMQRRFAGCRLQIGEADADLWLEVQEALADKKARPNQREWLEQLRKSAAPPVAQAAARTLEALGD